MPNGYWIVRVSVSNAVRDPEYLAAARRCKSYRCVLTCVCSIPGDVEGCVFRFSKSGVGQFLEI
jgi:hypothetical protein